MGGKSTRAAGLLLAVLTGVLGVLLAAVPAAAHNSLASSDPKNGATLDRAPARITLAFLARLDPKTTKVTVTGPDNVSAADGAPAFAGAKVTVPFAAGPAGQYTVAYEVASSDGHPIKGRVRFTLTVGAPAPSTPPAAPGVVSSPSASLSVGPAVTPGAASPSGPAGPSVGPTLTPLAGGGADDDRGTAWWPWAAGGVVLLGGVGTGALLLRRRRSTPAAGTGTGSAAS